MSSSTDNIHEELVWQKIALLAQMAEVERLEQETVRKEAEVACMAEAAWLAAEKAARKAAKKGKNMW